jgi:hypothetical protein
LIRLCTPETVPADLGDRDAPQPIFILGLPRSGTTLLDRLLGSHPEVTSAGELEDFAQQLCWAADRPGLLDGAMLQRLSGIDYPELGERYLSQTRWRARSARFFIDKQPWNHAVAGLIARALPGARILHISREPMDVCFSNYRAMLGGRYAYSFDLEALAGHYLDYCRLQEHWRQTMPQRMLDLSYHELVHDTESTMRKVVAFCGLDWSPACMGGRWEPQRDRNPERRPGPRTDPSPGLRTVAPIRTRIGAPGDGAGSGPAPIRPELSLPGSRAVQACN